MLYGQPIFGRESEVDEPLNLPTKMLYYHSQFFISSSADSMRYFKLLSFIVFCSLWGSGAFAAEPLFLTDESDFIYGKGVHAFFDRHYDEAVTILSKAEEVKNNDPRSYYFLGLAYLRQNKTELADTYFEKAAKLEFSGRAARDYAVSESLRRIQGEERQRLEKIRAEERSNAQIREQRQLEIRYGRENAADRESHTQPSQQNQKEDLAVLQNVAEDFGGNVFGVKPMDPTNTANATVAAKKTPSNPFGGVVANLDALPKPVEAKPVNRSGEVPVNVPARKRNVAAQAAPNMNPIRSSQAAVAKELGRSLRTLFSKKTEPSSQGMSEGNTGTESMDETLPPE